MFCLIKQVLIVLSGFSEYLAIKYVSLYDEPCMVRPTFFFFFNPVELKYYPFMVSLDRCNGSCSVLSPKICLPKKQNTKMLNYLIW